VNLFDEVAGHVKAAMPPTPHRRRGHTDGSTTRAASPQEHGATTPVMAADYAMVQCLRACWP
jgi:hypothetical protein